MSFNPLLWSLRCTPARWRLLAAVLALSLASDWAGAGRLSAGAFNTYAVDAEGTVWVWGANLYGQICDGTTNHRYTPTQIPGLTAIAEVSAGGSHGLARRQNGSLASWGLNGQDSTGRGSGQLGDGTRTNRSAPVDVLGANASTQVVAGQHHSLARQSDGSVLTWGENSLGQLGDGTTTTREKPVAVPGATAVTALAGGCSHSLALRSDGTVLAWGFNSTGQLGDGSSTNRLTPVVVAGLNNVTAIAAGCGHSVALKSDGTVWAWGFNFEGQLGTTTAAIAQRTPVLVGGLTGITAIASGNHHTLALGSDGRVWSWGKNDKGQLGDGSLANRFNVVAIGTLSDVTDISAGQNFSVVLARTGQVFAWGQNDFGQLGNGTAQSSAIPTATRDASGADFRLKLATVPNIYSDADKVFDWAERTFAQFFAPAGQASQTISGYRYRAYSGGHFLAVNDSGVPHLYYLGSASGNTVLDLGLFSTWVLQAGH